MNGFLIRVLISSVLLLGHSVTACAIQRIDDLFVRYSYFKKGKGFLYNSYQLTNVVERLSQ